MDSINKMEFKLQRNRLGLLKSTTGTAATTALNGVDDGQEDPTVEATVQCNGNAITDNDSSALIPVAR